MVSVKVTSCFFLLLLRCFSLSATAVRVYIRTRTHARTHAQRGRGKRRQEPSHTRTFKSSQIKYPSEFCVGNFALTVFTTICNPLFRFLSALAFAPHCFFRDIYRWYRPLLASPFVKPTFFSNGRISLIGVLYNHLLFAFYAVSVEILCSLHSDSILNGSTQRRLYTGSNRGLLGHGVYAGLTQACWFLLSLTGRFPIGG